MWPTVYVYTAFLCVLCAMLLCVCAGEAAEDGVVLCSVIVPLNEWQHALYVHLPYMFYFIYIHSIFYMYVFYCVVCCFIWLLIYLCLSLLYMCLLCVFYLCCVFYLLCFIYYVHINRVYVHVRIYIYV